MSSAYGKILKSTSTTSTSLSSILPITTTLQTINTTVTILPLDIHSSNDFTTLISHMHNVFNEIIKEGNTYPQEFPFSLDEFINYFLSYDAFIALKDDVKELDKIMVNENIVWDDKLLGMFYIKPNYPGRCSHICNAGFVVPKRHRGKRVGKLMVQSFLKVAPLLGYKSSIFNLVFENNVASIKLWREFKFKEIGRIPNAGRLKKVGGNEGEEEFVDAIMFYYDFEKIND
ncbi:294_t:CDS:2 [Funneliformis caledonium]|uniref:294_t:CDS:1 n=1 Tax=Funneliformis caledonium TaxID=1117310 RepID=A0A9N8YX17_9GLOM|nr:294_t:CDS:2 [Funneliformis caledonium]